MNRSWKRTRPTQTPHWHVASLHKNTLTCGWFSSSVETELSLIPLQQPEGSHQWRFHVGMTLTRWRLRDTMEGVRPTWQMKTVVRESCKHPFTALAGMGMDCQCYFCEEFNSKPQSQWREPCWEDPEAWTAFAQTLILIHCQWNQTLQASHFKSKCFSQPHEPSLDVPEAW